MKLYALIADVVYSRVYNHQGCLGLFPARHIIINTSRTRKTELRAEFYRDF